MKLSGRLVRRSALVRRTPLEGGQPPKRTPLRTVRRRTGPAADVMGLLAARSGGRCEIGVVCGGHAPAVDPSHRMAKGMGGTRDPRSNTAANNLHACRDDHDYIEGNPTQAYDNGWKIRRGITDPTTVPVRHAHLGWVLLHLDGSWTRPQMAECGIHPTPEACKTCRVCRLCGPCQCEIEAGWLRRTPE